MTNLTITIFLIISVLVIYSPIYFQRKKNWRIADEDLKKIDKDEWKKQMKSNAYVNLFSRILWGVILLSLFAFNLQIAISQFEWITVFIVLLGALSIIWGIFGFRREINKLKEIE